MRKCKQVISLLLVLTMMLAILSTGIVQTAAADNGEVYPTPLLGDVNRDGKVDGLDVYDLKSSIAKRSGFIRYDQISKDSIEFRIANCFIDAELGLPEQIDSNDVFLIRSYIAHKKEAMDKGIGEPLDVIQPTQAPTSSPTAYQPTAKPTTKPTTAPTTKPTTAPTTKPTTAKPTTAPTAAPNQAEVTVIGWDGESETQIFNIGDSFTVYSTLNASNINGGKIASVDGEQLYTSSILTITDECDPDSGEVIEVEDMFPVMKDKTVANAGIAGEVNFNASNSSLSRPFVFNGDDKELIVTHYTVTAPGKAEVRTTLKTLALADEDLTRLVTNGEKLNDDFRLHSSFYAYGQAPTAPPATQAPTAPPATKAPATQAPTVKPTTASDTATITIYGLNGQSEKRVFNVGDTFTVYTSLNAAKAYKNGMIAAVNATQTYSSSILTLKNSRSSDEKIFTNTASTFPVLGDNAIGRLVKNGTIQYNASTPQVNNAFRFDSDDDMLIVTKFTVKAGGNGVVRNTLTTLVAADNDLTRLIDKGTIASGTTLTVNATFDDPSQPATTAPTTKPTSAPATTKPTSAPATTKPTSAPATTKPTSAPATTKPTSAPATTKPTTAPTTKPTTAGTATVTVIGWDGESETQTFNIGETFKVYTTLNASKILDGKIASVDGLQTYTSSVLTLADAYEPSSGEIIEVEDMFPIMKDKTVANGGNAGEITFNASNGSTTRPFVFNSDTSELIVSQYTVKAAGTARISTTFNTLASADEDLTRIVTAGNKLIDDFRLHSSFIEPSQQPTGVVKPTSAPATTKPTSAPATTKPTSAPATTKPTSAPATTKPTSAPATTKPTSAPATTKPTTAPTTKPTTKPTTAPTTKPTTAGKATVTVIGFDGEKETKTFNIGDTFKVYTTLNASDILDGKIASINGEQTYTSSVLTLANAYEPSSGEIIDVDEMFPVTTDKTVANGGTAGEITFNASTPSMTKPFVFNSDTSELIVADFTVKAAGTAEIKLTMETLACADEDLTRIIQQGSVLISDFRLHSSFTEPSQQPTSAVKPTTAPTTKPTTAPTTKPTTKPTTAPTTKPTTAPTTKPTTKPTTAPTTKPTTAGKATVTVIGFDGEKETKTFTVGDTFKVYTTLNTSGIYDGKIASLKGVQTYTSSVLTLADAIDPSSGELVDVDNVFPVTGDKTVAGCSEAGAIEFNASTPSMTKPFVFNSDTSELSVVDFTVTAAGTAEIKLNMETLACADEDLTRIISNNTVLNSNFRLHSSFIEPSQQPTSAVKPTAAPTQAPTAKPTAAPTQAPTAKPTAAPTQAPTQAPTAAPTQPPTDPPSVSDGFYLIGPEWDINSIDAAQRFEANPGASDEYMLGTTLTSGQQLKVVKVEGGVITAWYPDGMDNEYNVDAAHAGSVDIYFRETYNSEWSAFGGYFYIDNGSTPEPTTGPDPVDGGTILFTNNKGFSTVNIYYWATGSEGPIAWPGTSMTYFDTNEYGEDRYIFTMPSGMTNYIINDGSKQTVDIPFTGSTGVYMLDTTDSQGHYNVGFYEIEDNPTPTPTPTPTTAPEPTSNNDVTFEPGDASVADPAWFAWVWNNGSEGTSIPGTKSGSNIIFSGAAAYDNILVVRMPTGSSSLNWSTCWNQSDDIAVQTGKTLYFSGWGSGNKFNIAWK